MESFAFDDITAEEKTIEERGGDEGLLRRRSGLLAWKDDRALLEKILPQTSRNCDPWLSPKTVGVWERVYMVSRGERMYLCSE